MTEIEKMLGKENAEKKRIARGAHNKKRGGGRYVRTPSDYLTKKEREALNGEVISFDPRKFYTWQEFKAMPDEFQLKRVNSIINRYDVGIANVSEICFGMSKGGLRAHMEDKGLLAYVNKCQNSKAASVGKERLLADVIEARSRQSEAEDAQEETASQEMGTAQNPAPEAVEEIAEENTQPVVETVVQPSYDGLTALIAALRGTGAKITIEVTL